MNTWKLFTYAIKHDHGYAPNPFHGICTLNTCKPQIRREANVGDWIVGLKKARVIYLMKVTEKMSMSDYWKLCQNKYPRKIPPPKSSSSNRILKCGDCQYDFSGKKPIILDGFHTEENMKTDLGGKFTLLSDDFIYFGSKKQMLPTNLQPIAKYSNGNWIGQARKSTSNASYRDDFIKWVKTFSYGKNALLAGPSDDPLGGELKCNVKSCGPASTKCRPLPDKWMEPDQAEGRCGR